MPRPRTAVRERVLAQTRQQLLEAASAEFAREGYVGANINRISQIAGFAKGTIYNHFASKRALMLSLIDEIAVVHTDFVVQQVKSEQDPIRRLERFFSAGFAFVEDNPTTATVIIQAVYGPDKEFKQRVFEAYGGLQALIGQDIVGMGVAQGDFCSVDPVATVALIMSVYWGSCSMLEADGKFHITADQASEFVLQGLRRRDNKPGHKRQR